MSGLIAFGSMIFLWFFIKKILKSNTADNNNSKKHENIAKRRRNNHGYERHLQFMKDSERNSPGCSHLAHNIWNND